MNSTGESLTGILFTDGIHTLYAVCLKPEPSTLTDMWLQQTCHRTQHTAWATISTGVKWDRWDTESTISFSHAGYMARTKFHCLKTKAHLSELLGLSWYMRVKLPRVNLYQKFSATTTAPEVVLQTRAVPNGCTRRKKQKPQCTIQHLQL